MNRSLVLMKDSALYMTNFAKNKEYLLYLSLTMYVNINLQSVESSECSFSKNVILDTFPGQNRVRISSKMFYDTYTKEYVFE